MHVYDGSDLKCMQHPFPWQASVIASISAEPDDRTINWVYNKPGNAGKSKLVKYLCFKCKGVASVPFGTATQMKSHVFGQGPHRTFMVDLHQVRVSGRKKRQEAFFSLLKEIKNGCVKSHGGKKKLFMEPPHVWVFSKELPDAAYASGDRWAIHKINGNNLVPMNRLDVASERAQHSATSV